MVPTPLADDSREHYDDPSPEVTVDLYASHKLLIRSRENDQETKLSEESASWNGDDQCGKENDQHVLP